MKTEFEQFEISNELKKALLDIGYLEPTQIQKEAIPEILNGRDLIRTIKNWYW